jgi:enamine deaminase RidA (YjgF/YER057c/UK114 family)
MTDVTYLNPDGLPHNPAFSQGVSVGPGQRTVYVGGQNAVAADGSVVGEDIATQTTQALRNVELVVAAAGGGLENVVWWSMVVLQGQPIGPAVGAFGQVWGQRGNPPAITVSFVAGLGRPEFLLEITAIAVV